MARTTVRMLVLFLLFAGSATAWGAGRPAPAPAADPDRPATLGMVAYADPRTQYELTAPLAEYLGRKAGLNLHLKLYADYFSLLSDIDHESLDVAIVSPLVYTFCMDDPALTFLATSLEAGKPFYHGALLARKDSPLLSVRDLAGKTIAFVDPYSASGYVYPAAFLLGQGLVKDGKPLYKPVFCGSHEKVLRSLLEGKVDAAATYDSFFAFAGHQVGGRGNLSLTDFRVLKLLPEQIPSDAVVCRSALGPEVITALETALHHYERDRAAAGSPLAGVFYSGFKPRNQAAYVTVKTMLDRLPGGVQTGPDEAAPAPDQ